MFNGNFWNFFPLIDAQANNFFVSIRSASTILIFHWVTILGAAPTVILLALAMSVFLWLKLSRRPIVALWITIVGSEGFTYIAKLIFQRSRPETAVFLESSFSFPSGHATIAVAFYGFLTYLLLSKIQNLTYRLLTILLCTILILVIGLSRLILGVHYISDVLAGYLVGLVWLLIGITLNERMMNLRK